ncbi:Yip1 family protein [Bacteroides propionicifaciens]|uniref:Yip1 family protein n=1 Tax=Bacteroides propionicifaciens TaxID=392838 RepID=UPI00036A889B|nr:Yip1 family protein [Bacteroides propionicifaciens]
MNYKQLFNRISLIISKPQEAWRLIQTEDKQKMMTSFVYPLLALSGIAVFLGQLLGSDAENAAGIFAGALTQACIVLVSLFGGLYLASFVAEQLFSRFLDVQIDRNTSLKIIGYGFTLTFLQTICIGLLPDFRFIVYILQFYALYILWEAIPIFLKVKEEDRLKATVFLFSGVFLCPFVIEFIFGKLILLG